jgi:hypothetical protein
VESQADFIIADHARKHQPVGSISWRWVEASVNEGELADIEDHRAGPTTKPTRKAGSGSTLSTKKSRTAFTEEDDRVLMEWCARAERKGLSLAGNVIFQDLEEKVGIVTCFAEYHGDNICRIIDTRFNLGGIGGSNIWLIDLALNFPVMKTKRTRKVLQMMAHRLDLQREGLFPELFHHAQKAQWHLQNPKL